ncbi:hypothetical protein MA16_Dca021179 [Dendrobium catenatum]|uniref:Uncharacterized protein n=1 Tax=Dendrobium catenatum TaxID=906689 RepID=A0A2I0XIT4_9ASPA|nr:hypothetical protein MA16_Dca021179 [Dendrobium catenatum]
MSWLLWDDVLAALVVGLILPGYCLGCPGVMCWLCGKLGLVARRCCLDFSGKMSLLLGWFAWDADLVCLRMMSWFPWENVSSGPIAGLDSQLSLGCCLGCPEMMCGCLGSLIWFPGLLSLLPWVLTYLEDIFLYYEFGSRPHASAPKDYLKVPPI